MKIHLQLLSFFFFSAFNVLSAGGSSSIQIENRVVVFTDPVFTEAPNTVKTELVPDNITRAVTAAGKGIAPVHHLVPVFDKTSRAGTIIKFPLEIYLFV